MQNPNRPEPQNLLGLLNQINADNLSCDELLKTITDWEIYTQDGPCDETMFVSLTHDVGILKDECFGLRKAQFPMKNLAQCGWEKVGDVSLADIYPYPAFDHAKAA